jgi:hypothetical protein
MFQLRDLVFKGKDFGKELTVASTSENQLVMGGIANGTRDHVANSFGNGTEFFLKKDKDGIIADAKKESEVDFLFVFFDVIPKGINFFLHNGSDGF